MFLVPHKVRVMELILRDRRGAGRLQECSPNSFCETVRRFTFNWFAGGHRHSAGIVDLKPAGGSSGGQRLRLLGTGVLGSPKRDSDMRSRLQRALKDQLVEAPQDEAFAQGPGADLDLLERE